MIKNLKLPIILKSNRYGEEDQLAHLFSGATHDRSDGEPLNDMFDDVDDNPEGGPEQPEAQAPTSAPTDELTTLRQERDRLAQRASLVDQFEQNPEQTIRNIVKQMGMEIVDPRGGGGQGAGTTAPAANIPQAFTDKIKASLGADYEFLAPQMATAMWEATQSAIEPVQQRQQAESERQRATERDAIVSEMDKKYPGWKDPQVLSEMEEVYRFLYSSAQGGGSMRHAKHGSVQELLYKLATGKNAARADVLSEMSNATRNGTSSSTSDASTTDMDVQKQIKSAKSESQKWLIALRRAAADNGVTL